MSKVAKPDLITYTCLQCLHWQMAVGKMTIHDSKAVLPAIEDTQARGVVPEHLLADVHYSSTHCLAQAKSKGGTCIANTFDH